MSTNSTKIARKRASSIVPGDRILDGRRPGFTVEAVRPAAFAGVAEVVVTGTTDAGVPARRIWARGAIVAVRPKVDGDAHYPNGCHLPEPHPAGCRCLYHELAETLS